MFIAWSQTETVGTAHDAGSRGDPAGRRGPSYLAVADVGVAVSVGREHAAQRCNAVLILEGVVLGHRTMKVALDLLRRQRTLTHSLLQQVTVVTAVGGHLILGPWGDRRK